MHLSSFWTKKQFNTDISGEPRRRTWEKTNKTDTAAVSTRSPEGCAPLKVQNCWLRLFIDNLNAAKAFFEVSLQITRAGGGTTTYIHTWIYSIPWCKSSIHCALPSLYLPVHDRSKLLFCCRLSPLKPGILSRMFHPPLSSLKDRMQFLSRLIILITHTKQKQTTWCLSERAVSLWFKP